jgi:uncharacterized protein HemY
LNGFAPLVAVLIKLERRDAARAAAIRWLEEAQSDAENRANAHQALGRIALREGDLDSAEKHLNEAIALDATHPARGDLARVHAARGDGTKAREVMIGFLATAPLDEDTPAHWADLEAPRD